MLIQSLHLFFCGPLLCVLPLYTILPSGRWASLFTCHPTLVISFALLCELRISTLSVLTHQCLYFIVVPLGTIFPVQWSAAGLRSFPQIFVLYPATQILLPPTLLLPLPHFTLSSTCSLSDNELLTSYKLRGLYCERFTGFKNQIPHLLLLLPSAVHL